MAGSVIHLGEARITAEYGSALTTITTENYGFHAEFSEA